MVGGLPALKIESFSVEILRVAIDLARKMTHLDWEIVKTFVSIPGGVEKQTLRVGDYFDKIELLPSESQVLLIFHVKERAASFWKDMLVAIDGEIRKNVPEVKVTVFWKRPMNISPETLEFLREQYEYQLSSWFGDPDEQFTAWSHGDLINWYDKMIRIGKEIDKDFWSLQVTDSEVNRVKTMLQKAGHKDFFHLIDCDQKTMKILKPGVIPVPKSFRGKCNYCGCEFECAESDLYRKEGISWTGNAPSQDQGCYCPTCKKEVPIHKMTAN